MTPLIFDATTMVSLIGFSLIIGSFLNVCIVRIPKGESIVFPPSHCTSCGKKIPWRHNIPLLSYLFLRGKCRECGARFSFRYFLVEALTPLLFLGVVWKYPYWQVLPFHFYLMAALIVSTFIDIDHWIIPDKITLPGIVIGLASAFFVPGHYLLNSIAGLILGGGSLLAIGSFYMRWKKIEGIGGGDVKLLAMAGAFLGSKAVLVTLIISSVLGSLVGIVIMLRTGKGSQTAVQFGPFLALGIVVAYFWGDTLADWYLNLSRPLP